MWGNMDDTEEDIHAFGASIYSFAHITSTTSTPNSIQPWMLDMCHTTGGNGHGYITTNPWTLALRVLLFCLMGANIDRRSRPSAVWPCTTFGFNPGALRYGRRGRAATSVSKTQHCPSTQEASRMYQQTIHTFLRTGWHTAHFQILSLVDELLREQWAAPNDPLEAAHQYGQLQHTCRLCCQIISC